MTNPTEGENTNPIGIIEYGGNKHAPVIYILQAQEVFLEKFEERFILSVFARNLARSYVSRLTNVPESEYSHPLDIDIAFTGFKNVASAVMKQLSWVFFAANGNIEGKRILDLGCGSIGGTEDSLAEQYGSLFQPWLCRTLVELGAYPIGVDIGSLENERFETYRTNLLVPNALAKIPDNSIDVVHSRALFTSPELDEQFHKFPPPWLSMGERENYFMQLLRPQVERVLRPDGVFVYSRDL